MSKCKKWLLNWLKLQQKGGVEPTGTADITENGVYDVAQFEYADVNVPSAVLTDYFTSPIPYGSNSSTLGVYNLIKKIPDNLEVGTSLSYSFYLMKSLIEMPDIDTSSVTDTSYCLTGCSSLVTARQWDLSHVTNARGMFSECSSLVNVPVYNLASCTTPNNMFNYVTTLSDESLDNILQSCISMTSYTGTKKLTTLGISTTNYSRATIQGLEHYSAFVSAGWSID